MPIFQNDCRKQEPKLSTLQHVQLYEKTQRFNAILKRVFSLNSLLYKAGINQQSGESLDFAY